MTARYVGLTSTFDEQRLVINAIAEDVDLILNGTPNLVAGVVTATSFNGNVIGNVTGNLTGTASTSTAASNAYGLLGTPNINVGVVTATSFNGNVTGNLTGTASTSTAASNAYGLLGTPSINVANINANEASFSGKVSIAGTLTYEDVTNVDSIGLVTARSGAHVATVNGNLLVGTSTSTGTVSQKLQVTGGAYVSGSVGIGTTNPVTPLHISDGNGQIDTALYTTDYLTISAQNTAPGFNIIAASNSNSSHRGVFKATRSRGTLSSPVTPFINDNTFSLLGAIYDGSTSRATAAINMDVDGDVGVGTAPQRITFWTGTGSSRFERARIQSTGEMLVGSSSSTGTALQRFQVAGGAYFNGRIGIGTTNPQGSIHICRQDTISGIETHTDFILENPGLGNARFFLKTRDNNRNWEFFADDTDGSFGIYDGIATARRFSILPSGNVLIGTSSTIGTGTVDQRLQVTGGAYVSGSVAIGATVPRTTLQVSGNFLSNSSPTLGVATGNFYVTGSDNAYGLLMGNYSSSGNAWMQVQRTDGTATAYNLILQPSGGNIGIGTINPTTKLDVLGLGQFNANGATLNLAGTDHSYIQWYPDGVSAGRKAYTGFGGATEDSFTIANQIANTGNIVLDPGANASVLIDSTTATGTASQPLQVNGGAYVSGNLGVGATNPDRKFVVSGDTNITGYQYKGATIKTATLFVRGTGLNANANRIVYLNDTAIVDNGASRGLTLTIINSGLTLISNTNYDTFGSTIDSDNLATAITNLTSGQIAVLTSYDAWESNVTNNLRAAALKVGLSKLGSYSASGSRRPYAAVFYGSSDDPNAAPHDVIERMESDDADAPRASIFCTIATEGTSISINGANSTNALYSSQSNTEDPVVVVSSSDNVGVGILNPAAKLHVVGDSIVSGVSTANQSRFLSVAERIVRVSGNTANISYTSTGSNIAFCLNPTGDITLAVTDIPTDSSFDNHAISFTLFVNQTGVARSCTAVTLNGVSKPILWAGGSLAAAVSGVTTTRGYDIYNFVGINTIGSASNTANYEILGVVNGGFR